MRALALLLLVVLVNGLNTPLAQHRPTRRVALTVALGAVATPGSALAKDRVAGYPKQYDWEKELTSGQFFVLRNGGTEPPNSSPLVKEKRPGIFVCAGCSTPLFQSDAKFESGTGWPSFATPLEGVETITTFTSAVLGSELRCASCGGHLGDVFKDGKAFPGTPAFESGYRYCIDGAALTFMPSDGNPPSSGDGLTKRRYSKPADVNLPPWLQPPKVG